MENIASPIWRMLQQDRIAAERSIVDQLQTNRPPPGRGRRDRFWKAKSIVSSSTFIYPLLVVASNNEVKEEKEHDYNGSDTSYQRIILESTPEKV